MITYKAIHRREFTQGDANRRVLVTSNVSTWAKNAHDAVLQKLISIYILLMSQRWDSTDVTKNQKWTTNLLLLETLRLSISRDRTIKERAWEKWAIMFISWLMAEINIAKVVSMEVAFQKEYPNWLLGWIFVKCENTPQTLQRPYSNEFSLNTELG